MDALPVPFILPFNHLELEDFVLRERLKRALAAFCLEVCNAFSEVGDHSHDLMDALPGFVALGYQTVDCGQGCRGGCD